MWTHEEILKLWQTGYFSALEIDKKARAGIALSLLVLSLPTLMAKFLLKDWWWIGGIVEGLYLVYTFILWILSSVLTSAKAHRLSPLDKVVILMGMGYDGLTGLILVFAMLWVAELFADALLINPGLKWVGWSLSLALPISISWLRVPRYLKGQGPLFSAKEQAWGLGLSNIIFGLAAMVRGTDYEPILGMALGVSVAIITLPLVTIRLYQIVILSWDWWRTRVK